MSQEKYAENTEDGTFHKVEAEKDVKDESVKWGYDLYPERRGENYKPSWSKMMFLGEGRENIDNLNCERKVYACIKRSPLVKLMMNALKSSGW
ncbi:unnamed protein product [Timema podura]|uniref:Uncharacterized protein n=1 Tax=Timema podura TaxID=61482 RepID=A0ABN7PNC4_TIMPD|nr:unnamed protein product [Timema podura]